jgi:uncharacterized protein (DUF885 family)
VARKPWLLACLALATIGCANTHNGCAFGYGTETIGAVERFETVRNRFFVQHLLFNPVTATYLGADGYSDILQSTSGALKDYSESALSRELAFYRKTQDEMRAIAPELLPENLQVDHRLMDAQLAFLIRLIGERKYHQRAVDTYVAEPFRGVDWHIQQMQNVGDGLRGTEDEWKLLVSRVEAIPRYLKNARANLNAGKQAGNLPDWRLVQRDGIAGSLSAAEYFLRTLPDSAALHIGNRPFGTALLQQLRRACKQSSVAWESFAEFLKTTYEGELKPCTTSGSAPVNADGSPLTLAPDTDQRTEADQLCQDRYASGVEEYEWRVRNVLGDPRTAAELYDYGGQQVAHYSALIRQVVPLIAKQAGLKTASVRDVVNHLAKDAPKNDDELFAWYRDAAGRAVAYGRDRAMFDVPQDYNLEIIQTPPLLRSAIEAAYYTAPPFKKSGTGRFYLTPTDNVPAKLKLNNRASVADTAVHEGFPGHDWHFKFMTRHAADISNIRWLTPGAVEDSSSMWIDSMAAEGWALYAEELMAEATPGHPYGFYSTSEYFYQLQGQMMRAVRVRVDVGIHTGRMTFEQARDFFVEHVEFYPGACARKDADAVAACDIADREIYRYSKWPTQAITYNLGKNGIMALREEYKKKTGTAYSPRSFHEKLMRVGPVPVRYFRDVF